MRFNPTLLALLLLAPLACADDSGLPSNLPEKIAARRHVDALIHQFQSAKKPATLGLLCQTIDTSIAFGAPAWNLGDHDACADFYINTVQALATAFPDSSTATPEAWASLTDLKAALARTAGNSSTDRNAWAMRFAFDKTELAAAADATKSGSLLDLGTQYLQRGNFDEALDAFNSAVALLHEMDGQDSDTLPLSLRLAPFAQSNALFAQKRYAAAEQSILAGLTVLHEWPLATKDFHDFFGRPAVLDALIADLADKAAASPNDPALQFLLGYHYFFTDQKDLAKTQFEKTLQLAPNHPGAKLFLHPPTPKPAPTPRVSPMNPSNRT